MKLQFLFAILCLAFSTQAQSPLEIGESQANFGFGLNDVGIPIYAGLDYGIANDLTVGGVLGLSGKYGSVGGNVNYHFNNLLGITPEWNVYAGANAGFFFDLDDDDGNEKEGLGIGAQLGARYFIDDRWGVNLEAGGGNQVSGGKLGVTLKF